MNEVILRFLNPPNINQPNTYNFNNIIIPEGKITLSSVRWRPNLWIPSTTTCFLSWDEDFKA